MNHIFQSASSVPVPGANIVAEIEHLVNELMHRGVLRRDLEARVTGGAQVLLKGKQHGLAIADVCLRYLEQERIPLRGASIGGKVGRRVRFDPVSGRLIVGFLRDRSLPGVSAPVDDGNAPELF